MDDLSLVRNLDNNGCLYVEIAGRLAIDTVASLHELLKSELSQALQIKLDLTSLTDIDICGVQLICAACHTTLTTEKSFSFSGVIPSCASSAVNNLGLNSSEKCKYRNDMTCVWFKGAK